MKSQEALFLDFMYSSNQKTLRFPEILHWSDYGDFVDVVSLDSNKRHFQLEILTRLLLGGCQVIESYQSETE